MDKKDRKGMAKFLARMAMAMGHMGIPKLTRTRTIRWDQEDARRVRQIDSGFLGPMNRGVVRTKFERDEYATE